MEKALVLNRTATNVHYGMPYLYIPVGVVAAVVVVVATVVAGVAVFGVAVAVDVAVVGVVATVSAIARQHSDARVCLHSGTQGHSLGASLKAGGSAPLDICPCSCVRCGLRSCQLGWVAIAALGWRG